MRHNKGRFIRCDTCNGTGMVSDYGAMGTDFEGPKECDCCGGNGRFWVYRSGVCARYYGGPLTGMKLQPERIFGDAA